LFAILHVSAKFGQFGLLESQKELSVSLKGIPVIAGGKKSRYPRAYVIIQPLKKAANH
jgi:hypothetical protein